jgi:hypothetical protein
LCYRQPRTRVARRFVLVLVLEFWRADGVAESEDEDDDEDEDEDENDAPGEAAAFY